MKYQERIGERYGCFEITAVTNERGNDGNLLYEFTCMECGYKTLKSYKHRDRFVNVCTHVNCKGEHKDYRNPSAFHDARLRKVYNDIISRCYNLGNKDYRWYGGKGVRTCQEWYENPKAFEDWAESSGYSNGLTIDRVDADGDYSPENCRWITIQENARRAGKVNWITVNDETLTGRQWADKLGIGQNTVNTWIRKFGLDKTREMISSKLGSQT